jgi:hypothetical protein
MREAPMLTHHERRALADIEQHLRASEPDLACLLEQFHRWAPPRRRRLPGAIGLAGLVLGAVLLAVAFGVHSAAALLLTVTVFLADAACWTVLAVIALVRSRARSDRKP